MKDHTDANLQTVIETANIFNTQETLMGSKKSAQLQQPRSTIRGGSNAKDLQVTLESEEAMDD